MKAKTEDPNICIIKVPPSHKWLTNYKGENNDFMVEKPGGNHPNCTTKVTVRSIGTNQHCVPLL
jgi:hypothetical protein